MCIFQNPQSEQVQGYRVHYGQKEHPLAMLVVFLFGPIYDT